MNLNELKSLVKKIMNEDVSDKNKKNLNDFATKSVIAHDDKDFIFKDEKVKLSIDYSKMGHGGSKIKFVINDKETIATLSIFPDGEVVLEK